jgi:hypothetical protein
VPFPVPIKKASPGGASVEEGAAVAHVHAGMRTVVHVSKCDPTTVVRKSTNLAGLVLDRSCPASNLSVILVMILQRLELLGLCRDDPGHAARIDLCTADPHAQRLRRADP